MSLVSVDIAIKEVLEGEKQSFRFIVESYKNMVFSLCLKICNSKEEAEELTQDTFIKVYRSLHKYKGNSKFSTWVYKIAYFTAISHLRKKKKYNFTDLKNSLESEDLGTLEEMQIRERDAWVRKAIDSLDSEEKLLVNLFYMDELSIREVAFISQMKENNVKVKIHRIRKKLHSFLITNKAKVEEYVVYKE